VESAGMRAQIEGLKKVSPVPELSAMSKRFGKNTVTFTDFYRPYQTLKSVKSVKSVKVGKIGTIR
jgi:hypothetical protein